MVIRSTQNPQFKELLRIRKRGIQSGFVLLEGLRSLRELQAHDHPMEIIVSEERSDIEADLVLANHLMDRLCETQNHQGVLMKIQPKLESKAGEGSYLILDRIADPGNFGTLLRSAIAFGIGDVITLEGSVSAYNDKVLRSSLGAVLRLRLHQSKSLEEMLAMLGERKLYAADMQGLDFQEAEVPQPFALVIGNEAHGLDEALRQKVDQFLCIPMKDEMESLNAAVAGSILLQYLLR